MAAFIAGGAGDETCRAVLGTALLRAHDVTAQVVAVQRELAIAVDVAELATGFVVAEALGDGHGLASVQHLGVRVSLVAR